VIFEVALLGVFREGDANAAVSALVHVFAP
jgi:hypothetical protein